MSSTRIAEPKQFLGTNQLLFDRLIDFHPFDMMESANTTYLDKKGVVDSIVVEIERLLNTRIAQKRAGYETQDGINKTVIAYGLPSLYGMTDFGSVDATNKQDWGTISQICLAAIEHFEPRIKNVEVLVDYFDGNTQRLYMNINADLALKYMQGEVSFPVSVDCGERNSEAS